MDYIPVRRLYGNQLYLMAGVLAHNVIRELQMIASERGSGPTGSALCRVVRPTHTASADFCQPIPSPLNDSSTWQADRSPRVRRATFIPYTRRIYFYIFRVIIGLWILLPPRPDVAASYAVAVRRAGTLLTASFRFHLTVDTLAVRLTVPITRVCRGLSPPSHSVKHHIRPSCVYPLHAMPGTPHLQAPRTEGSA